MMDHRVELTRRMARPQRHRLLQGYPMAPLMRASARPRLEHLDLDPGRPMIVGVLPHNFCNPRVRGCGFCTFPHEKLSRGLMRESLARVDAEIAATPLLLRDRLIEAIYFGGGTANLTPADDLSALFTRLSTVYSRSRGAELTLEGVPKYFLLHDEAQLDVLSEVPFGHRRLSMGVQTFSAEWLHRMGRDAFGDRAELEQLVASAHRRGFTISGDFLFNLPGAPLELALSDMRAAIAIELDQICAYNLVLTAELDTEWARDPELVAAMPDPANALATWLAVRETLLDAGYVQTTLTNFERAPRFVYERASFDPARRDGIGYGPGAISTFTARDGLRATKWINATTSAPATRFDYSPKDLRLLHLTRNLARMAIDCASYERCFGVHPLADFSPQFEVLEAARLVVVGDDTIALTPEGMFYADAVTGLLAHQQVGHLRGDDRDSAHHHMG